MSEKQKTTLPCPACGCEQPVEDAGDRLLDFLSEDEAAGKLCELLLNHPYTLRVPQVYPQQEEQLESRYPEMDMESIRPVLRRFVAEMERKARIQEGLAHFSLLSEKERPYPSTLMYPKDARQLYSLIQERLRLLDRMTVYWWSGGDEMHLHGFKDDPQPLFSLCAEIALLLVRYGVGEIERDIPVAAERMQEQANG